jgi:RNA polymerase sigma factor (sigma-70 family)
MGGSTMASGALAGSLRHLRDLFNDGTTVGLGDGQLLARYADGRDEAAFAALVARHGPMVLATCRAVLRHEHDVEDAFQATFLVLAKKARSVRAGDALGGWLHRVAYRVSIQAGAEARRRRRREAEASAMVPVQAAPNGHEPDVASIIHEELDRLPDRERLPVVLCDLEGLTYEQAAGRLRWTEPTLRHRLLKGRHRLRDRLTRRGVTASAVAGVLTGSTAGARAAVPPALARAAVAATTGGTASATATALSTTLIRAMAVTRLTIAATGLVAAAALVSIGVVAVGAGRADKPGAAMRAAGASNRPAAVQPAPPREARLQSPAGSGPGIEGRIVDLEGRPVAGARIEVNRLWTAKDNDLGRWLDRARDDGIASIEQGLSPSRADPATATTGPDGRFRLGGVGPERVAEIYVSGPTIATAALYATGRDGADIRATIRRSPSPRPIVFHARRFEYAAAPSKPIEGTIRDKDTGRPIAGIGLRAAVYDEYSPIPAPGIRAHFDARGHYRLTGLPRASAYRIFVDPVPGQPYPPGTFRAPADTPAFAPATFDIALKRGILVRGKVTDKVTGQPVSGYVNVYAFQDNPHFDEYPGFDRRSNAPVQDGRYEVVALPGRGLIGCRAAEIERYRGYVGAEAIKGYDPEHMNFPTVPFRCMVRNYNVVTELDLDPKAETATVDLQVDPGSTIEVTPVDPEGRPLAGTMAAGVGELFATTEYPQPSTTIAIHGLAPSRPRRVTVTHVARKLIGSVYLKGDEAGPLTIRLQPYGTIAGRIVDEDGRPRGGLGLMSAGGSNPKRPDEEGVLPGGNGGGIRIGRDGRFRVERLVPGLKYDGGASENGFMYIGDLFHDVTVAPGEVKDLGDLKVIPPKRDN